MRGIVLSALLAMAALAGAGAAQAQTGDERLCLEGQDRRQAIAACTRLIASGRYGKLDLSVLHSNRGKHYRFLRQYDAALRDQDEALRLNPRNALAHHNRGTALYSLGRFADAVQAFTAAVALERGLGLAYEARGFAYHRLGQYDLAIADYDRAAPDPPAGAASALYGRGIAWRRRAMPPAPRPTSPPRRSSIPAWRPSSRSAACSSEHQGGQPVFAALLDVAVTATSRENITRT